MSWTIAVWLSNICFQADKAMHLYRSLNSMMYLMQTLIEVIDVAAWRVAGSFEIALLRMTRAFDERTDSVVFGQAFVPVDVFQALSKFLYVSHCDAA